MQPVTVIENRDHRSNRKEKNRCATAHNSRHNTYSTRHIPLLRQGDGRHCRREPLLGITGSRQRKSISQHLNLVPSNGCFLNSTAAPSDHVGQTPTSGGSPYSRVCVGNFQWFGPATAPGVKVTFQFPGTGTPATAQVRIGFPQHTNNCQITIGPRWFVTENVSCCIFRS